MDIINSCPPYTGMLFFPPNGEVYFLSPIWAGLVPFLDQEYVAEVLPYQFWV